MVGTAGAICEHLHGAASVDSDRAASQAPLTLGRGQSQGLGRVYSFAPIPLPNLLANSSSEPLAGP